MVEIKLLVYQLSFAEDDKPPVYSSKNWFYHSYLPRLDDTTLTNEIGLGNTYNAMYSGIQNLFFEALALKEVSAVVLCYNKMLIKSLSV